LSIYENTPAYCERAAHIAEKAMPICKGMAKLYLMFYEKTTTVFERRKIMKKLLSIILCFSLLAAWGTAAFAMEPTPECKEAPPISVDATNVDILYESFMRGDNPPTSTTTLPYSAASSSTGINSYVYTNYKFKPSSLGKIHTTFTGNSNPKGNSVTVDIYLYDATAGNVEVASYSLGSATAWSGQGVSWYNLNTSHYYYFKIVKSVGSARLVFTLDCIAQNW